MRSVPILTFGWLRALFSLLSRQVIRRNLAQRIPRSQIPRARAVAMERTDRMCYRSGACGACGAVPCDDGRSIDTTCHAQPGAPDGPPARYIHSHTARAQRLWTTLYALGTTMTTPNPAPNASLSLSTAAVDSASGVCFLPAGSAKPSSTPKRVGKAVKNIPFRGDPKEVRMCPLAQSSLITITLQRLSL
jgi:hypothetical protein